MCECGCECKCLIHQCLSHIELRILWKREEPKIESKPIGKYIFTSNVRFASPIGRKHNFFDLSQNISLPFSLSIIQNHEHFISCHPNAAWIKWRDRMEICQRTHIRINTMHQCMQTNVLCIYANSVHNKHMLLNYNANSKHFLCHISILFPSFLVSFALPDLHFSAILPTTADTPAERVHLMWKYYGTFVSIIIMTESHVERAMKCWWFDESKSFSWPVHTFDSISGRRLSSDLLDDDRNQSVDTWAPTKEKREIFRPIAIHNQSFLYPMYDCSGTKYVDIRSHMENMRHDISKTDNVHSFERLIMNFISVGFVFRRDDTYVGVKPLWTFESRYLEKYQSKITTRKEKETMLSHHLNVANRSQQRSEHSPPTSVYLICALIWMVGTYSGHGRTVCTTSK